MGTLNNIQLHSKIGEKDESRMNTRIDKDVQRLFRPLNLMQAVLLNPKYHTKNNCIHPNNIFNKLIITIGMLTLMVAYLIRALEITFYDFNNKSISILMWIFIAFFDFSYQCIGLIMNFIIHLSQTKKSISFVLRIQEVHRFLNNTTILKRFIFRNWMYVGIILGFYLSMFICLYFNSGKNGWTETVCVIGMASYDANLIYVMRSVQLLTDKIVLWNIKLLFAQQNMYNNLLIPRLSWAYTQILHCYQLITNIYTIPVLFKIVGAFSQSLLYVQAVLEHRKVTNEEKENHIIAVFVLSWVVKNLSIQTSLSLHFEAFYEAIKCAQNSCEFILVSNSSDDLKKLCKNVLRLHRASFSKMTACGLFYIDVCHPLRLITILTHYTIVLLQFAFL